MPGRKYTTRAEQLLVELGVTSYFTDKYEILGCIGCSWMRTSAEDGDARAHGYEIAKCIGNEASQVSRILGILAEVGLVTSVYEDKQDGEISRRGPPRHLFKPLDTEKGRAFLDSLDVPSVCMLNGSSLGPAIEVVPSEKTVQDIDLGQPGFYP